MDEEVMIRTEEWTGGTEEEYETQHFGFGAQRLKIAIRQMVEQKITTSVKGMESELQELLKLNDTDKLTISKSCDKLIQLYCERVGLPLAVIDIEIARLLNVPSNVLLPEDECQSEQISGEEFKKLKEEVASLRKRVERGALMEALLTAEANELATVDKVCETAIKDMKGLEQIFKTGDSSETLKTILNNTQFLCASATFMNSQECDVFEA
ncbi:hypothetical protein K1T71_009802 [Dendrolimus kikuchii]|uniref:Uncharacterized protein n=1 Tax=Dendrolimus kikuchii TaxID=765133 RepID=A0ACC1CSQ0_9NEOP|nr:hypothetical protein K1T71_009802 [Dendrolimus kikuchii]